ncbi:hypothetical protein LAZ67_3003636 [Cordylochernes scorpioides]|uniref:C2H2-type domain-containing protein n=1 Tax=Cordylochernes scorpioides TaxID=51811 RepID=A0ABY6KBV7_9ARAC|nr:hypothetical protein LAZ67_3003636 [Cordylochernes scorpioides]
MLTHSVEKPFKCEICDHKTSSKFQLDRHLIIHNGEKRFKCEFCDYKAIEKGNLNQHLMTHTGEKPFKCDFCDYRTSHNSDLKRHLLLHTGEKPFKCECCDYRTSKKHDLIRHNFIHTGKMPFECQYCDFKTSQKGSFKSHSFMHTGGKPFKCKYCNYQTTLKGNLGRHFLIHTGEKHFKCDFCDYKVIDKGNLNQHLLRHTGEKPFKCEYCDYRTGHNGDLKKHLLKHTSEKPYKCKYCDFKTDHLPLIIKMDMSWGPKQVTNPTSRAKKKCIWLPERVTLFVEDLGGAYGFWNNSIDNIMNNMVNQIKSAMVQNGMQIEIKTNNSLSKPWFDHECYIAKKIMKATLTKYIKSNKDLDRLEYVKTRNKYTSIFNNKKKKYFCEIQEKLNNTYDSSEFWKTIARFRKRNYTQGNISISDWQEFYNKLLDTESIPDYEPVTMTFLNTDNELTKCITLNEISKEISRIRHGKAAGFDDIMNEAIKALPKDCLISLKDIFNRILRMSEFPTTWLKSVIQPIFKNGDPDDPSNYRGIALLSNIAKLFTSILKSRLGSWIERRNIVPENQAGFRAGHSCQDHIFTLLSLIQMTLSRKRRKCYMFFVDLKKAFDTVPHSLLWRKLVDAGLNHHDIVLIGESKNNLQIKINMLRKYFETNLLTLNENKSKIVVFRNGGRLAQNDKWFWGERQLSVTTKYLYLGHPLSSANSLNKVASHYKGKALAAIGAVWQVLTKSKMNSLNAAMRLLDSTVLPHMLYAAPCWALNQVTVVDQVQNIFLRRYLNLPKYTPGFMLRMECGRVSQEVIITKQVLRFWVRIMKIEEIEEEIVSLGKSMGLEVEERDVNELIEEHTQELTTEEIQELQSQQHTEVMQVIGFEESEEGVISTSEIKEILGMWERVSQFVEKKHPEKVTTGRASDLFNDTCLTHFATSSYTFIFSKSLLS